MQKESPQSESCPWRHKLAKKHILVLQNCKIGNSLRCEVWKDQEPVIHLGNGESQDSILEFLFLENIFKCTRVGLFLFCIVLLVLFVFNIRGI